MVMNSRGAPIKFWLQWVGVSTLSLGMCFAFLGWVEGLRHVPNYAYTFDVSYPNFLMSIASGCLLGLMQWLLLKPYFEKPLVPWLIGSIVGITLMAMIGCFGYSFYIWGNFNTLSTRSEEFNFSIKNGGIAGFLGGMTLGCIQGRTFRHKMLWSVTNALAWALAWGISRSVTHMGFSQWSWHVGQFPLPIMLAIEMGRLGTIAGLISSAIAGVVILQVLPHDRPSEWRDR
ncbi:MAG: hypothetical protein DCF22_14685 [Leptolyngbya sp.]|nr:MAG: hypothetical protein DCF22_14685 [Leptolyngbya sp.]